MTEQLGWGDTSFVQVFPPASTVSVGLPDPFTSRLLAVSVPQYGSLLDFFSVPVQDAQP